MNIFDGYLQVIRGLAGQRGLALGEVGRKASMSVAKFDRIVNGRQKTTVEDLDAILTALDVTLEDFVLELDRINGKSAINSLIDKVLSQRVAAGSAVYIPSPEGIKEPRAPYGPDLSDEEVLGKIQKMINHALKDQMVGAVASIRGEMERVPCPYCAEMILPAAIKCMFCQSDLPRSKSR